jgi:tetratricopeptide (TPR) repeat protein
MQAALLERAGGNPLYAEEFARIAAADGANIGDLPLPESVQGLIAARIDALADDEKAALEHGAVVGRVFWSGAVASLGATEPATVEAALHALARKEFVQRERRSSVAGDGEYAFRHGLVREVAYGQIPRARRAELHGLAARWIEDLGRPDDYAELLAHHYLRALEYARAAGQDVAALEEPARLALREAGDRAAALNAFAQANRFYGAALELWPADDPERFEVLLELGRAQQQIYEPSTEETLEAALAGMRALGRMERAATAQIALADVLWSRGETDGARTVLAEAAALMAETPPSAEKAYALGQVARFAMLDSRPDEAVRFGEEALAMATTLGLEETRADVLGSIAAARSNRGELGTDAMQEQAIAILEPRGSVQVLRAYNNLLHVLIEYGELERADEVDERALAGARRFAFVEWFRWINEKHGQLAYLAGRWAAAETVAASELATMESRGAHYLEGSWHSIRSLIALARGDREGLRTEVEAQIEEARRVEEPQMLQPVLAQSVHTFVDLGDLDRADALLAELLASLAERLGMRSYYWLELAIGALELGRAEAFLAVSEAHSPNVWVEAARAFVQQDFARAAETYGAIRALPPEATARQRLAEQHLAAGRRAAGEAELERASAFWRSVGATAYLDEALELAS